MSGWQNMSLGWRRATERMVRRGPTQEEEQALRARREAWLKQNGCARDACPHHLRPPSWMAA